MKKTFPLKVPGTEDQRVVESIKNDVRKYLKRERRKALPAGVDFWDFACRVGLDKGPSDAKHVAELIDAIEAAARNGATEVYVEILAIPGHRTKKPLPPAPDGGAPAGEPSAVRGEIGGGNIKTDRTSSAGLRESRRFTP